MQSSVRDYFKTKKRTLEPDFKASKLLAASSSSGEGPTKRVETTVREEDDKKDKEEPLVGGEEGGTRSGRVVSKARRKIPKVAQPASPVKFVHKGMLSPTKKPPKTTAEEIRRILKNKGKLADLKAALEGINGCAQKLAEFRQNVQKGGTPTTPEKFYSAGAKEGFTSPAKLVGLEQKSPTKKVGRKERLFEAASSPAYQRFHNLSTTAAEVTTTGTDDVTHTQLPLPYKYKVLDEVFNAVETVTGILHNRKETITFGKVQSGVQKLLRKTPLKETHLGQILTVFPDCYRMSQEKLLRSMMSDQPASSLSNYHLIIALNLQADDEEGMPMSVTAMTRRRKTFKNNLIRLCHQHHKTFLETLVPPLVIPENKSVTRWHPRFKLDDVPAIPPMPLPIAPQPEKLSSAKDVINRAQALLENANPRMKKAVQDMLNARIPPPPPESTNPPLNKNSSNNKTVVVSDSGKKAVSALKGISQGLIDKIRAREQEKSIRALTLSPVEIKRNSMLAKLPDFVKIIRNTFIAEKKAALPLDLLVDRIGHSFHGTFTLGQVEDHTRLLCSVLPEWIKLLSLTEGQQYLKMERQVDINDMLTKLDLAIQKTK